MNLLDQVTRLLFDCQHPNLSRVFTIQHRSYQVCCDCGAEFDYSFETMPSHRVRLIRPRCGSVTFVPLISGSDIDRTTTCVGGSREQRPPASSDYRSNW